MSVTARNLDNQKKQAAQEQLHADQKQAEADRRASDLAANDKVKASCRARLEVALRRLAAFEEDLTLAKTKHDADQLRAEIAKLEYLVSYCRHELRGDV